MSGSVYDCIILGGGASGLFAASMLVKLTSGRVKILLIDGNDRCGKKLALTGSGRCNLSNKNASSDKYSTDCPELLDKCLDSFGVDQTIRFFEDVLGVVTVCDDGLYYPATYRASTVIDSFRFYLEESGCELRFGSKCERLTKNNGLFEVSLKDGNVFKSRAFICSTGGFTYPATGSDGSAMELLKRLINPSDIVGFSPALTSLTSRMQGIKALAGIRCRGRVELTSDGNTVMESSEGEVIFSKEGGISGICIMDISGKAVGMVNKGTKPVVAVNLLGYPEDTTAGMLSGRRLLFGDRSLTGALAGMLPRVLCEFVCRQAELDPAGPIRDLSDKDISRLAKTVCALNIVIDGYGGTDKAQVSSGGVRLSAMNENMQYKGCQGMYITGEALNVDGKCGGYNLQWAWSSAAAAAKGVAESVRVDL